MWQYKTQKFWERENQLNCFSQCFKLGSGKVIFVILWPGSGQLLNILWFCNRKGRDTITFFKDSAKARGCSHWFIKWFGPSLFKIYLWRRHAKTVKNGAFSHKPNYIEVFFRNSKSWRASKVLYRFTSYDNFAEWVDFAY